MASARWHWVSEDGSEHEFSEEELIAGLSSEHVPVYALVWREGWGEWLPAMQVAELSWALPAGQADNPRRPSPGSHQRPVPNLSSYALLRARAAKIREQGTTNPNAEAVLRPRAAAPKSTRRVDLPQQPSLTLPKPPLAKNPPERNWPPQVESEDATVVERPMRGPPPQAYSTSKMGASLNAAGSQGSPVWRSRLMIIALLGAALVAWLIAGGMSGVTKVVRSVKNKTLGDTAATPSATATALDEPAPAPAAPVPVCKVRRGRQLAEWAEPSIRPTLLNLPTGNVAVGYAQTKGYAIGINVSLKSLDREFAFHDAKKQGMFSVVPSFEKGQLVFGVTRAPSDIINATAVSGSIRRVVGQGQGGVAMREGTGAIKRIWQLPENGRPISVPVTARLANGNAVVTFRAGTETGSVQVGTLDAQGKPSELVRVESGAQAFGEPSLTTRGDTTVIVFTGRKTNEANWNIYVASALGGAVPTSAKPLSLGTPNSTSTFIGPLGEHHYLLMWTDRSALESITKTVVLDEAFRVLGSPMELSTETQVSTSAGLAVSGTDALAAYFVKIGENTEMWGASLRCL